jgi:hypothetical protein
LCEIYRTNAVKIRHYLSLIIKTVFYLNQTQGISLIKTTMTSNTFLIDTKTRRRTASLTTTTIISPTLTFIVIIKIMATYFYHHRPRITAIDMVVVLDNHKYIPVNTGVVFFISDTIITITTTIISNRRIVCRIKSWIQQNYKKNTLTRQFIKII